MFQRFGRMRAAIVLVSLGVVLGMSATALGIGPEDKAFRPAGTTRYAWASANTPQTTQSTSMVDMPNLSQTITIPAGKSADLFITFSGVMNTGSAGYVRAIVNNSSTIASPGAVQAVYDLNSGATTHSFTFFRQVGPGTHTVKIQWSTLIGTNDGKTFISHRSLMVTANIR